MRVRITLCARGLTMAGRAADVWRLLHALRLAGSVADLASRRN